MPIVVRGWLHKMQQLYIYVCMYESLYLKKFNLENEETEADVL